jgi:hypothetical protein
VEPRARVTDGYWACDGFDATFSRTPKTMRMTIVIGISPAVSVALSGVRVHIRRRD